MPAGGGALPCSGLLGLSTIAAERQSPTSHRMVLTTSLWHAPSTPEHALDIAGEPEPCFCALLSCCTMAVQPSGFALLSVSFPLRSYVRPVVPYCGRSGAVRSLGVAVAASPRQRAAAVGLGAPGDDLTNGRVCLRV